MKEEKLEKINTEVFLYELAEKFFNLQKIGQKTMSEVMAEEKNEIAKQQIQRRK